MNDPFLVRGLERFGDLVADAKGLGQRQRALLQRSASVLPGTSSSTKEPCPSACSRSWTAAMLGWFRAVEELRFPAQAGDPLRICGERLGQDLEGHVAVQLGVERAYTSPMPPAPIFSSTR